MTNSSAGVSEQISRIAESENDFFLFNTKDGLLLSCLTSSYSYLSFEGEGACPEQSPETALSTDVPGQETSSFYHNNHHNYHNLLHHHVDVMRQLSQMSQGKRIIIHSHLWLPSPRESNQVIILLIILHTFKSSSLYRCKKSRSQTIIIIIIISFIIL